MVSALYCSLRFSGSEQLRTVSKIMIGVLFVSSILNLAMTVYLDYTRIEKTEVADSVDSDKTITLKHKPNIYYLLVDAYARQDTLKETANFDNSAFLQKMEKENFIVSRSARSNYHFTIASLSATMNMKYHERSENKTFSRELMYESAGGDNDVRNILRQNGYQIINIPAHWYQTGCRGHEDVCLKGHNGFEIYESYLKGTPLSTFNFPPTYLETDSIKRACSLKGEKPKFIFAHFAQIHDSIYDDEGNFVSSLYPAYSGAENAKRYVASIKVMNKKILDLVTYIRIKDPTAVIIIQADHGPTYTGKAQPTDIKYWLNHFDSLKISTPEEFRYTFGIFSAIYIPKYDDISYDKFAKYFSGDYTLVNTFRYLFSYLSEESPNLLAENSHFIYYDSAASAYKEDDITHLIN